MRGHELIAFSGIQYASTRKYLLPLREAGRKRIGASRGDALLIMYVCEFSYILRMYTYIHTYNTIQTHIQRYVPALLHHSGRSRSRLPRAWRRGSPPPQNRTPARGLGWKSCPISLPIHTDTHIHTYIFIQ